MQTLLGWYPGTRIVRTHCLYQSEKLSQLMCENYHIETDCSIYLRNCGYIMPHKIQFTSGCPSLIRVPHFFQDNMDMQHEISWRLKDNRFQENGLKVFDFHPIHMVLNSANNNSYETIKSNFRFETITPKIIKPYINSSNGTLTLFTDLVKYLSKKESYTIGNLVKIWKENKDI